MDGFLLFMKNYGVFTVVLAIILIAVIMVGVQKRKQILYQAVLHAVTVAQEAWGSDMGKIKFAEVYTYIKQEFPVITFFMSEEKLRGFIEDSLVQLKEYVLSKANNLKKNGVYYEDMDNITRSIIDQTGYRHKFTYPKEKDEPPASDNNSNVQNLI